MAVKIGQVLANNTKEGSTTSYNRCVIYLMQRMQIQLPDRLFGAAQGVAKRKEISMAELVRQGLEYMVTVTPAAEKEAREWSLPEPRVLHSVDPFRDEDWRARLHARGTAMNYRTVQKDNA